MVDLFCHFLLRIEFNENLRHTSDRNNSEDRVRVTRLVVFGDPLRIAVVAFLDLCYSIWPAVRILRQARGKGNLALACLGEVLF